MGVSGAFIHLSKAKTWTKKTTCSPSSASNTREGGPTCSFCSLCEASFAKICALHRPLLAATKLLPSGKRTYPPCSIGNTSSIRVNFQPAVSVDKRVIVGNCYCSSDFIPWIDFLLPRDGGEQTKGVIHRVAPLHEFCLQLKRQMSQLPWFIISLTFKKKQATF